MTAPLVAHAAADPTGSLNRWKATFAFGTNLPTAGTSYLLEAYDKNTTTIKESIILTLSAPVP